jgi:hypothetical protein
VVEVERIGSTPVSFRVTGTVRHLSSRDEHGRQRVGLQISFESPHEQRIAKLFA